MLIVAGGTGPDGDLASTEVIWMMTSAMLMLLPMLLILPMMLLLMMLILLMMLMLLFNKHGLPRVQT